MGESINNMGWGLVYLRNNTISDMRSKTLDYIDVRGNIFSHRQIEYKHGLVFMRMKTRKIRNS
tara:strand:- start:825 stop:1013 length:189 start_codon:yes stop_codon:yes gene_type:complete